MKELYIGKICRAMPLAVAFAFLSTFAIAQITVTGIVTSDQDDGLPGVNVIVKGTSQGTITDTNGRYSIDVPSSDATLVFSYVGYLTEEVIVGDRSTIDMMMTPDVVSLSEVVVVGYGTEKKKDLTGAISTISSQDFARVPAVNPLDALAARAPGLSITSSSNMPGSSPNVVIRGVTSFGESNETDGSRENDFANKNSPIYVVDGLITDGINNLSPNDIESISVLKDGSAVAIYGARAAKGVILVTTKRGAGKGKPTISFNTFIGLQEEGNLKRKLLNSDQYIEIFTESYDNEGVPKQWTDADLEQYQGINTDWKELIKRTGVLQNYELSVMGGNENSNYYVSGGYKDNKMMIKSYDFTKYTLLLNSDHKINDWIKFGNSLNVFATETNGAVRSLGETVWQDALTAVPIKRAYEDDGRYGFVRNSYLENGGNMLFGLDNNVANTKTRGLMGNIYLTINLLKGLKFTTRQSLEWEQQYKTTFTAAGPTYLTNGVVGVNQIRKENRQTFHTITDFLLDYNKQFNDMHNFSALVGYSIEEWQRETLEAFRAGTPNNEIQFVGAGDPSTQTNENRFYDWGFLSMFGRLNYSFRDKYLIGATVRRDGSSKLAKGNRFGVFPSVSAGWRISGEEFMKNVTFINDLKLRGSIGSVGNVNALSNYATVSALDSYPYATGQQIVPGYTYSDAVNTDITWETTVKKNIGLDATILNNHVYTNIDFYIEDTDDILFQRAIAPTTGRATSPTSSSAEIFVNAGKVRNRGIEVLLGYVTSVKDWSFDFNINLAANRNKVIDLGGADLSTSGIIEGYPVRSFFGYATNGIITSQEVLDANPQGPLFANKEPGDVLIVDVSGREEGELTHIPDGQINADDRWIIGNVYPKAVWGFMGNVGYKNLTLQIQLQGVTGLDRDIGTSNDYGLFHYYLRWALNHDAMILDRWHATKNPDGSMPRVDVSDKGKNRILSDYWLRDASFLRIKNINLNYNIPKALYENVGIRDMGVYFSVQNLWTFTNFPGQEVDSTVDPMTGVPQPRTYTLGFRATF
jgi:TonB-linked SusC/RagA family outer membrane protein